MPRPSLCCVSLLLFLCAPVGVGAGHDPAGPTACIGGSSVPAAHAATLSRGAVLAEGIVGVEGEELWLDVESMKYSHGYVTWRILDQRTGDEWLGGVAAGGLFPILTEPSPYDRLCIEVRNDAAFLQPVWLYVVAANP